MYLAKEQRAQMRLIILVSFASFHVATEWKWGDDQEDLLKVIFYKIPFFKIIKQFSKLKKNTKKIKCFNL